MTVIGKTGLALLLSAGVACANEAEVDQRETRPADLRLPRDGNIAIREELDGARRAATVKAYDFFIRRHPDHPLAEIARRERAEIAARGGK